LVNAGHCPPLLIRAGGVEPVESTGFPIGLVGDRPYETRSVRLQPGETLFLYTDGLTEARREDGAEYGTERLSRLLYERRDLAPRDLANTCRDDLKRFLSGASRADDLTLMAVRRRVS